jgi:hypothetical protein
MNDDWREDLYLKNEFKSLIRKIQRKNENNGQSQLLDNFVQKWSNSLKQRTFSNDSSQNICLPTLKKVTSNVDCNFLFRCIPLQHHYTKENLSFSTLKGNDSYLAGLFSKSSDLQVFLALKCKRVRGITKINYGIDPVNERRQGYWDEYQDISENEWEFKDKKISSEISFDCLISFSGVKLSGDIIPWTFDINEDTLFRKVPDKQRIVDEGRHSPLKKWYYSACLMVSPRECFYQWLYEEHSQIMISFVSKSLVSRSCLGELALESSFSKEVRLVDQYLAFFVHANADTLYYGRMEGIFALTIACEVPRLSSCLYDHSPEWKSLFTTSRFLKWSVEAVLGLILLLIPSGESVLLLRIRDDLIAPENNQPSSHCLLHKFLFSCKVWDEVDNYLDWSHFRDFMKVLCCSRISVLKFVEPPSIPESWAFPEIEIPYETDDFPPYNTSLVQDFLKSETESSIDLLFSKMEDMSFLNAHPYLYSLKMTIEKESFMGYYQSFTYNVTVSKTRAYFQRQVQLFQEETQENIFDVRERIKYLELV